MKKVVPLLILNLLISVSCGSQKNEGHSNVVLLEEIWDTEGTVMLSDIASSIEYIPLQKSSDQNSILPAASRISVRMTENHFIIYGRETEARIFSSTGEFLCSIGRMGRGPGEYITITRVLLTPDEKTLWIFDSSLHKLMLYSIDGEFLREMKVDGKAMQATIDPDGNIYLMLLEYDRSLLDSSKIKVITQEGVVKDEFSLYKNRRTGPGATWHLASRLIFRKGALEHFEPPYDTLFRYQNGEWKPKLILDVGPNQIPFEAYSEFTINDILESYSFISMLSESEGYMFLRGVDRRKGKMILVDKNTLSARPCDFEDNKLERSFKYQGLINDIDGGMPFWPRSSYKDLYLIALIDPLLLIDYKPAIGDASAYSKNHRKKLDDLMADIDQEDNPIVMVVRL